MLRAPCGRPRTADQTAILSPLRTAHKHRGGLLTNTHSAISHPPVVIDLAPREAMFSQPSITLPALSGLIAPHILLGPVVGLLVPRSPLLNILSIRLQYTVNKVVENKNKKLIIYFSIIVIKTF